MGLWYHICKNAFILETNLCSTYICASSNISIIVDFLIWAIVLYHIETIAQNITISWSKYKLQTMRYRRPKKMRVVRTYFLTVLCDFKYVSDVRLPTTSHNLSRRGHFLLSRKKDVLKYFCFLAGKKLLAVPTRISEAAIWLQLRGTIVVVIY